MSHFSVLVVGDNIDDQLAPYHEYESTGANNKYVQNVDITDEIEELIAKYSTDSSIDDPLTEALEYYGIDSNIVKNESEVDINGVHAYGYAIVDNGKLVKAINRTNPNKKWDWYSIGGRWTGFFLLKPGAKGETGKPGIFGFSDKAGYADSAKKGDIDFETMITENTIKSQKYWDEVRTLAPNGWDSWDKCAKLTNNDQDATVKLYHSQAGKKALRSSPNKDLLYASDEVGYMTREQYVTYSNNNIICPYALLYNGQWMSKGEMGWFGMSSDELSSEEWAEKVSEIIKSLSDDTLLTIVDCHI